MRRAVLAALVFAVGCGKKPPAPASPEAPSSDPPPLHAEQGKCAPLRIEQRVVADRILYHRLVVGDTLHGAQVREIVHHFADQFMCLGVGNPWENVAVAGALYAFDPKGEPVAYAHRTGPLGAAFRVVQGRAGARAAVGVVGMKTGAPAAYAVKGQTVVFYETDPAIKRLTADTDRYFSYVADARKRGATVEVKVGDRRAELTADTGRKFGLLVVDPYDNADHPTDLMTKEAVQLYFARLAPDGLLAFDISNKFVDFEPMFARVAEELKLVARVWNDPAEGATSALGKNASSWMVFARDEQALGPLAVPTDQQLTAFGSRFRPADTRPEVPAWTDAHAAVVPAMEVKR
ncbi:MAG: hypothetical protein ACKODX_10290 [Gemmata sp.]